MRPQRMSKHIRHAIVLVTLAVLVLLSQDAAAQWPRAVGAAREGYLTRADGTVVETDFGECWHTRWWRPAMAVPGCDGAVAAAAAPAPAVPMAKPAPAPNPVPVTARVYFSFDRSNLDTQAQSALDAFAARLAPTGTVTVYGYTDRIGTEAYNQGLSKRRAQSVRDYLVEAHGVSAARIETHGYGERNPVVQCGVKLGWRRLVSCLQPNRRADVSGPAAR